MNIPFNDIKEEGLYLIFPDSSMLALTNKNIQAAAKRYWEDPEKIPPSVKSAIEFQRCPFCPLKHQKDLCDALRPVLPYLEVMDKYISFDKVTAIYKGESEDSYYVSDTTMQLALQFISIMSLMRYCQAGRRFWKYYLGINPLISGQEMARILYLNIYYLNSGDKEAVKRIIKEFSERITSTSANQVRRMSLIAKSDVFMNAFASACVPTMFLSSDIENITAKEFEEFEKKAPR